MIEETTRSFLAAREAREAAEEEAKKAREQERAIETELARAMEKENMEHVRLNGRTFYLYTQTHVSVTEANTEAIRAALLRDAGNDEDFVRPMLVRARVQQFYVERWKKGLAVPEELGLFAEARVGVRS